jgi:hypothetical protein
VWPHPDEVWDVTLSDGTVVHTTGNHPWWDDTRQAWIRADHLVDGDQVLTAGGSTLTIAGVQDSGETQPTYNLTVTGPHTYYVGDDSILVHNCVVQPGKPMTTPEATAAAKQLGFEKIHQTSHREAIYTNGKVYITLDNTSHNGGVWKMARTIEDLGSKETRMGTYDADLNRIGD